jgi:sugar phosphate isomerase/epimerase
VTGPALGVNTYSYIWTTRAEECVRRLADLGYRTFELMVHPVHLPLDDLDPADRRRLASLLVQVGARDCTLNLPSLDQNLASALSRVRAFSVEMFRDVIDLASDLGIECLVTVPGRMSPLFPPPEEKRTAWMQESVEALLPHAEKRGVRLAIENVPVAAFPDAASLGSFVRGFDTDRIGVCYDAANAHFIGESPAEGIRQLADVLRVFHLSDTGRAAWKHDRIGTGTVPFAELAPALIQAGFSGPSIMEIVDPDPERAILESHQALAQLGFAARDAKAPA